MSIKVTFVSGGEVEYPDGVGVSESPDGSLKFVNDVGGNAIATLTSADVKEWHQG